MRLPSGVAKERYRAVDHVGNGTARAFVTIVASSAVPKAPPRFRSMLNSPDAGGQIPAARIPTMAMLDSGDSTIAWPTARTIFGIQS